MIWKKHKMTGYIYNIQSSLIIKSPKEKVVIGRIENNKFISLDKKTIELCQKYNLSFDVNKINISFNWYDENRDTKTQEKYDDIVDNTNSRVILGLLDKHCQSQGLFGYNLIRLINVLFIFNFNF